MCSIFQSYVQHIVYVIILTKLTKLTATFLQFIAYSYVLLMQLLNCNATLLSTSVEFILLHCFAEDF